MGARARPLSSLGLAARGGADPEITGIAADSREVGEGFLFAALPGSRAHGAEFAGHAARMGAACVLTDARGAERAAGWPPGLAVVVADAPREALGRAAALWFGGQPDVMCAVTGTNGKTSVATFTRRIWIEMGLQAISLGTAGVEGAWTAPLAHTTPEPVALHRALAEARARGVTHAAMEASSHGLDQRRLDGVVLRAAGFTNLSRDHLDYHATPEAYFDAKAALFARVLPADGTAVICMDGARGADMAAIARARGQEVLTVGRGGCDLRLAGQRLDATGQDVRLEHEGRAHAARLPLIGAFQADNVLVACGLAIACGAEPARVFEALPRLGAVRGRMQLAATRGNGAAVFVDYSHTPGAVAAALGAMRPHVMGRLVAVLGAGGDRDRGKRPLMGRAAAENADIVFVTDDNPRSEDPALIRAAVMEGALGAGGAASVREVGDRAEAILRAVDALGPGDALLVAGKGGETGQVVGDDVLPFDDAEQASVAVAALEGRRA